MLLFRNPYNRSSEDNTTTQNQATEEDLGIFYTPDDCLLARFGACCIAYIVAYIIAFYVGLFGQYAESRALSNLFGARL